MLMAEDSARHSLVKLLHNIALHLRFYATTTLLPDTL